MQHRIVFAALGQHVKPQFAGPRFDMLFDHQSPHPGVQLVIPYTPGKPL